MINVQISTTGWDPDQGCDVPQELIVRVWAAPGVALDYTPKDSHDLETYLRALDTDWDGTIASTFSWEKPKPEADLALDLDLDELFK